MAEIEQKQNYLREQIIDCGYDPDMFTKYIIDLKGEDGFDLEHMTMTDLVQIVKKFKADYEEAKQQGIIKDEQAEESTAQAKSNPQETPSQSKPVNKAQTKMQSIMPSQPQNPKPQLMQSLQRPNPSPKTKQQFFPQQTLKSSQVDGYEKIEKEVANNDKIPQVEETKSISSFIDKTNPLKEYKELISCNKLEKTPLTPLSKIVIEVKNPELIKTSIFSFAFLQFTIVTKELNFIVIRKLSDFEWFYYKINELYPGIAIPAFPLKKFFEKTTESQIQKKLFYAQKFINALIKTKVVRSSKLFYNFISFPIEEWKNHIVSLEKKPSSLSLSQFSTIEGMIEISINKELDDNASTIQKQIALRSGLHTRLTTAFDNVMAQMGFMSDALLELSNTYKDLSQTYTESIFRNDTISTAYKKIGNVFDQWSNGYKKQIDFFQIELKYFFKYIHKEVDCFTFLVDEYKNSRGKYFDLFIKLSKLPFVSGTQQAELTSLKNYYGYFMKQVLEEYSRLDKHHAKRLKNHFDTLTERKPEFIIDYMTFIQLVNFNF